MMPRSVMVVGSVLILLASLWIGAHWLLAPFTTAIGWERTWSELRYGQVEHLMWRLQGWRLTPQGKLQIVIGMSVISLGVLVGVLGLRAVRPRLGAGVVRQGARWAERRDLKRKGLL